MFIAKYKNLIVAIGNTKEELEIDLTLKLYDTIEETSTIYKKYNGDYLTEEEIKEKEKEAISHLKCTKRILALMLQQLGVSYKQLRELIATNEQAQLEWDLCVKLERSNSLLDIMGRQLELSSEQIDQMFKYANGLVDTLEVE